MKRSFAITSQHHRPASFSAQCPNHTLHETYPQPLPEELSAVAAGSLVETRISRLSKSPALQETHVRVSRSWSSVGVNRLLISKRSSLLSKLLLMYPPNVGSEGTAWTACIALAGCGLSTNSCSYVFTEFLRQYFLHTDTYIIRKNKIPPTINIAPSKYRSGTYFTAATTIRAVPSTSSNTAIKGRQHTFHFVSTKFVVVSIRLMARTGFFSPPRGLSPGRLALPPCIVRRKTEPWCYLPLKLMSLHVTSSICLSNYSACATTGILMLVLLKSNLRYTCITWRTCSFTIISLFNTNISHNLHVYTFLLQTIISEIGTSMFWYFQML